MDASESQPALAEFLGFIDRIVNDIEFANHLRHTFLKAVWADPEGDPIDRGIAELMLLLSKLIEERAEPRPPTLTIL